MILFLFALLFVQAIAGPGEDTADKILSSYVLDNGGKNVPASSFTYPYKLILGSFSTTLDVGFTSGQLTLNTFTRTGPVDSTEGLTFSAQIETKLTYAYDFTSSVPSTFASGKASIDWKAPVTMKVSIDNNNKASLDSITLLPTGVLVADAVPNVAGRTATLYPRGDSTFAYTLFGYLQTHLKGTFKNIAF